MLAKLLKYDLKYMIKNMSVFYILSIIFSLTTRILLNIKQTLFISIMEKISISVLICMVLNILFNTIIRSWARFNDSIYKDESYLTHTLPVTKIQLYESRFLHGLIFTVVGFLIIIISLFIAFYTNDNWIIVKKYINSISSGLNLNSIFIIVSFLVILFLEIFNIIQIGFLGIILGNKRDNNKIIFSFLFGYVSYMISQMIVLVIIFISALINKGIMKIFTSNNIIESSTIKLIVYISSISYLLIIFIINIICYKQLEKGVNV